MSPLDNLVPLLRGAWTQPTGEYPPIVPLPGVPIRTPQPSPDALVWFF